MSIISGNVVGGASYQIANSLRFDGVNDSLTKTFSSTGRSGQKVEFSFWCKRSMLGTTQVLINVDSGTAWYATILEFTPSDTLRLYTYYGLSTTRYGWYTTRVFRDTTAWMHIKLSIDTSLSGQSSRRLWINGVEETAFSTEVNGYNLVTMSTYFLGGYTHQISPSSNLIGGYLAEFYALDNITTSDATSYGEFDTNGVWVPKAYTGTYGTNGFHLDFSDGTSTTTLGYDAAGSNDWTLSGMTRAAGVSECWMVDTPTNNYATLNPLSPTTSSAISQASLYCATPGTYWWNYRGSQYVTSGKLYFEGICVSPSFTMIGVATPSASPTEAYTAPTESWTYLDGGTKYGNGSAVQVLAMVQALRPMTL